MFRRQLQFCIQSFSKSYNLRNKIQNNLYKSVRCVTMTPILKSSPNLDEQFNKSKELLNKLTTDVDNSTKLKIYGLFKQSTVGRCNVPKPGMMDFVGKAKWDAWNSLGEMSQNEAKQNYIGLIKTLTSNDAQSQVSPKETSTTSSGSSSSSSNASENQDLKIDRSNQIMTITFNRPEKYNAITLPMYNKITSVLNEAASDDSVRIAVFTGNGKYFCSGNDLNNFLSIKPEEIAQIAKDSGEVLKNFINSFIDFPKPIIGLVNGPAIGISVTILGLFDVVYASDLATFSTPFSNLGQSPEGVSSYTFPRIMGRSMANDVLMFGRKLTAQDALQSNLISRIFKSETFYDETKKLIDQYAKLPPNGLKYQKILSRIIDRDIMHKINNAEVERLIERWQSEECINAIMNFFSKGSKI